MKIKDNIERSWRKIQTRSGLALIITAALLLQVSGIVQYMFARNGIKEEVRLRARTELELKNNEIARVVEGVENVVDNLRPLLEWSIMTPDSIYSILEFIIRQNPSISGCAIAFEPDYFADKGRWYEPFAGRHGETIVHDQIGGPEHDYLNTKWYRDGLLSTSGCWAEPYLDDAGSQTLVCSYTIPLHDSNGNVVGLFCSDISLDWLADLFTDDKGTPTVLVSRSGQIMACPDQSVVMQTTIQDAIRDYDDSAINRVNSSMLSGDSGHANIHLTGGRKAYVYFAPVEGKTGWSMAVVFPDDVIYSGLHRVGMLLTVAMSCGLLLLVFIMWRTVRNINKLGAISAEKERMDGELHIARGIQMGMLPKTFPPFPDCDEVTMSGILTPAKEVGGDIYDFHVHDKHLYFCIGDVSGKGVPASLVMAVTRSLFRSVSAHKDSPDIIVRQMNDAMSEMNESSMFVTLFVGVLDLHSGKLAYSNAGHCPPVLVGDKVQQVDVDANIPLGFMTGWEYTRQEITMSANDTLFAYTDGLTEAENAIHAQFGVERMLETLEQEKHNTPGQMVDDVTKAVHVFVDGAEQSDDLTMIAVKFNTSNQK